MTPAPLVGYLGDDFSGSTDVMEVLTRFGLDTLLFTSLPTAEHLARVGPIDAIGIAGNARSLPVDRMEAAIRPVFELLRDLRVSIVHYKICSTFDSSPAVGSIGRALDLGAEIFDAGVVPILAGAPELGRYCVFGNLFARSGLDSRPFRLDRHPTMSRHPVTPMAESDLRVHLARQTRREIGLVDVLDMSAGVQHARDVYRGLATDAVLIDVLDEKHLSVAGELLLREGTTFAVGSSGVEMALGDAWIRSGVSPGKRSFAHPGPASPLLVLSGSCSPVTKGQVEHAIAKGFRDVAIDTPLLSSEHGSNDDTTSDDETIEAEVGRVAREALALLANGRNVVVHTALGPDDPRVKRTRGGPRLGAALGTIGRRVLSEMPLRRVVVTGGDTGWSVATALGIETLEMIAPMAPGSPLCRARGADLPRNELEIIFKGGQVGKVDLIERVTEGNH